MSPQKIFTYEFAEKDSMVGSDPVTCIVPLTDLRKYLKVKELDFAFSGYARYQQVSWLGRHIGAWPEAILGLGGKKFVGVWGKRNCQRLRRFLRERGANLEIRYERPTNLRLIFRITKGKRLKVRSLEPA